MNTFLRLGISTLALTAVTSAITACGDKPPPPRAPETVPIGTETRTDTPKSKLPETAPESPSSSAVRISDEIVKACGIKAPDAYFAFDSANLRREDVIALDQVTTCFQTGPLKGRTLRIVGHTDPRGSAEYNDTLGQSRADAVAKYVTGKGLDKSKAQSSTRGAMDAEGKDEPSWAKDRRVDLLLAPNG